MSDSDENMEEESQSHECGLNENRNQPSWINLVSDSDEDMEEESQSHECGLNENRKLTITKEVVEFDGDFRNIEVEANPKYPHYMDFIRDFNEKGLVRQQFLNDENFNFYSIFQVRASIKMHKPADDGEGMEGTEFHILTSPKRKTSDNKTLIDDLKKEIVDRAVNAHVAKSGWVYESVENIGFYFYKADTILDKKKQGLKVISSSRDF